MKSATPDPGSGASYSNAGVDTSGEESGLKSLLHWVGQTLTLRPTVGRPLLDIGYFANVLDLGRGLGLAISTDGVGTKILVAEMMHKYDTVGIDCIAMNVNDILCVGAEPISLVDYIAVQAPREDLLSELGKGLYAGAKLSNINIPGGEIAQVREMILGIREGYAFDLVGTCVGLVPTDRIIIGRDIAEGDVVVGLASSGVHSNGLTLARKVIFDQMKCAVTQHLPELGRIVGEELLEPTRIYVPEVVEMLNSDINVKALSHITSDGLLNLVRVASDTGFIIEYLPEPPAIFSVIQKGGQISEEEMYRVYNMGVGFCVTVPESDVAKVTEIAGRHGVPSFRLGYAVRDPQKRVFLKPKGLVGQGEVFTRE